MALLIYGSNGYTGSLIARRAAAETVVSGAAAPVLAGRNSQAVSALAAELRLPHRIFDLANPLDVAAGLRGIGVVLNCAGPFSRTALPLMTACLRARIHYLDITGEIEVFETVARHDEEARQAGITLLPGAGFDVVPSDCLAAHVVRRLPSAIQLALAFATTSTMSRGTALTTIENAHVGGLIRRAGKLVSVPSGWRTRLIDFGAGRRRKAITIPWGDVATAHHTTGVPNIEVYMALPWAGRAAMRLAGGLGPVLALPSVKHLLAARAMKGLPGPSHEQRVQGASHLWAEARDDAGTVVQARLHAGEPYELTSWTALDLAKRASRGELPIGYQTPARACGPDHILRVPGTVREDVPEAAFEMAPP